MSFITITDFKSHLKDYIVDAISENDESILQEALDGAEQTAASYLSRFDLAAIYATTAADRKPYTDLMGYIKDIAKYRFCKLSNMLNDWDVTEAAYKAAIVELGKIQSGKTEPKGWPYPAEQITDSPFTIASRPKRGNHI